MSSSSPQPNCSGCRHYFVTWEPQTPRGCRRHGFKSKESPADVVFQSSGQACLAFESKKDIAHESGSNESDHSESESPAVRVTLSGRRRGSS